MSNYLTIEELRRYAKLTDFDDSVDPELAEAITAAESAVNAETGRNFVVAGTSASARVFHAVSSRVVNVDDFASTTDLVVAIDTGDGAYSTTLTTDNLVLWPLNQRDEMGETVAYDAIQVVAGTTFPTGTARPSVKVTARWGWPSVPAAVKQATKIIALELYKMPDAPFGVAGFGTFGSVRVGSGTARKARDLLARYDRNVGLVVG